MLYRASRKENDGGQDYWLDVMAPHDRDGLARPYFTIAEYTSDVNRAPRLPTGERYIFV